MKKLTACLLLTIFVLSWCEININNWWNTSWNNSIEWDKTYKLFTSYKCEKSNINECKRDDWKKQWEINSITFSKDELNNFTFSKLDVNNKEQIAKLDSELWKENWKFEFEWNKVIISKNLQSCKTFDISLDITYYDWHSWENGELNKYIMDNRIAKLRSFLEWENSSNIKINEWDKINLRFIWTMKENDSQANLKDLTELYYIKPCTSEEITYTIWEDDVEINNMRGEISYYYIVDKESQKEELNKTTVKNMDDLIKKVSDEFYKRYWSMSVWTYLLDHLNESLDTYKEDQTNIIISDFFFQLSDSDMDVLKKKYCNKWWDFCSKEIYQFSLNNITNKYLDKYFFKNLFTKYIFEEIPSLNNLCPKNEDWKKIEVYLLWIDSIPWLTIQDKIKDYYSNYLLKNCDVKYK